MAKIMWRYNNDARAIIENVYKFCMEEKASGMKLSLAHVWDRTAALTGVTKSTAKRQSYKRRSSKNSLSPSLNNRQSQKKTKELIKEAMAYITGQHWNDCIYHVKRVEQQYWASDSARDEMPNPVVISLDSKDDESARDTASEDEDEP